MICASAPKQGAGCVLTADTHQFEFLFGFLHLLSACFVALAHRELPCTNFVRQTVAFNGQRPIGGGPSRRLLGTIGAHQAV